MRCGGRPTPRLPATLAPRTPRLAFVRQAPGGAGARAQRGDGGGSDGPHGDDSQPQTVAVKDLRTGQAPRPQSALGASVRRQVSSYAAKLEQARAEGRGTDPSEVNRLHPEALSRLSQQQHQQQAQAQAEQQQQAQAQQQADTDLYDGEWDEFGPEDEAQWQEELPESEWRREMEEDDEEAEQSPDPWGFQARLGESMQQLQAQPPAQPQLGAAQAGNGSGSPAQPGSPPGRRRGLGEVAEQRRERKAGSGGKGSSFEAFLHIGQQRLGDNRRQGSTQSSGPLPGWAKGAQSPEEAARLRLMAPEIADALQGEAAEQARLSQAATEQGASEGPSLGGQQALRQPQQPDADAGEGAAEEQQQQQQQQQQQGSGMRERLLRLASSQTRTAGGSFGASFYKAARALQARLATGVDGEVQQAIDAQMRQYQRRTVQQLRSAGVVVTDLTATFQRAMFSEFVWALGLAPDAELEGALEAEAEDALEPESAALDPDARQPRGRPPLPAHVFKKGDPVLLLHALADGSLPARSDQYQSLQASVTHVGRAFIKVTVSRDVHELLQEAGPKKKWRMDRTVQETTAQRQLQAISMLDKPYAYLEKREALSAARSLADREETDKLQRIDDEEAALEASEQRCREAGLVSKDFRVGELRVRQILLGDPGSAAVAKAPPTWASNPGWKEAAKHWLTEVAVRSPGSRLNRSQVQAIAHSLSHTLSLWQGPPGTGKTRTLLALLTILARLAGVAGAGAGAGMGPVLSCADTNAATDNILEGLRDAGVAVVRVGKLASVREELHEVTLETLAQKHPMGIRAAELREEAEAAYAERRAGAGLDRRAQRFEWEEARERLLKKARKLERDACTLLLTAQQQVLAAADVVCATCAGAGDTAVLASMRFRIVVLDEATQATEPSTLIPLLRGAECVVMAGDPKQLPPTVISDVGLKCSLDSTLFERLMDTGVQPWLLDTQYRMHPAIAGFPNDLFYGGSLKSGVTAADRPAPQGFPWPNPECPVALVECGHGRELRAGVLRGGRLTVSDAISPGASSYCNLEEAQLAVRAFEMLMLAGDAESGAILTPYNGQVKVIRSLVRQSQIKGRVVVSSVDGYQGREADCIVFSAVRNNPEGRLGFVTDERRLNVAITRPRRGLVVIGAPDTLSADDRWRKWLGWVRDRGGFLSPDALLLSPEEKASGRFDPSADAAALLGPKVRLDVVPPPPPPPPPTPAFGDEDDFDLGAAIAAAPAAQGGVDPDEADEAALAAFQREQWGSDDWLGGWDF